MAYALTNDAAAAEAVPTTSRCCGSIHGGQRLLRRYAINDREDARHGGGEVMSYGMYAG